MTFQTHEDWHLNETSSDD